MTTVAGMGRRNRVLFTLIAATALFTACGGGGGGGGGHNGPPAVYSISGTVAAVGGGSGVPGVVMHLSGSASTQVTTDANGRYSIGVANGSYVVTPTLSGSQFTPPDRAVEVRDSNVTGVDFTQSGGVSVVADRIEFMPYWRSSDIQYRPTLVVRNGYVYFSDSSRTPLKKVALDGSTAPVPVAQRFKGIFGLAVDRDSVYWVGPDTLNRTDANGVTTVLATGSNDHDDRLTGDVVVDASHAYWVNSLPNSACSPPCDFAVQRVPLQGGPAETLATVRTQSVIALAQDAERIYWEEASLDPVSSGCNCGSMIRFVPKSGGAPQTLVDGMLNGLLPPPPPGQVAGSWQPTGGLALTGTGVVFGVARWDHYQVLSISGQGGTPSVLGSVPSTAGVGRYNIRDLTVAGPTVYWLDDANRTLSSVPLAGGQAVVLASEIGGAGMYERASSLVVVGGAAYWSEPGAYAGCCRALGGGSLRKLALGSGASTSVLANLDAPTVLASNGTDLYWAELWRLGRVALAGGVPTTMASGISSDLVRFAADNERLYLLDGALIKTLPLAGGAVQKLAPALGGLIDDLSATPMDIATDGTDVYWTAQGGLNGAGVNKVSVTGGSPVLLAAGAAFAPPQDCNWRLALAGGYAYWSASTSSNSAPIGCAVRRVPLAGGSVTTVVDAAYLADFAVDQSFVYFSQLGSNPQPVQKVPVTGGSPVVAASRTAYVLELDATRLYWLDMAVFGEYTLGSIPKSATSPDNYALVPGHLYTDPLRVIEALEPDSTGVYVTETDSGSIYRVQ